MSNMFVYLFVHYYYMWHVAFRWRISSCSASRDATLQGSRLGRDIEEVVEVEKMDGHRANIGGWCGENGDGRKGGNAKCEKGREIGGENLRRLCIKNIKVGRTLSAWKLRGIKIWLKKAQRVTFEIACRRATDFPCPFLSAILLPNFHGRAAGTPFIDRFLCELSSG